MTRRQDIREIASLLDDVIAKGQEKSVVSMPLDELIAEHRRVVRTLARCGAEAKAELERQKTELERYIHVKGSKDLRKSLSFDPMQPVQMTADSSYYNPYRQLGDGSFAPHAPKYWMDQEPYTVGDGEFGTDRRLAVFETSHQRTLRQDGYREVERFYHAAGVRPVRKAELYREIDDLVKALPAGGGSGTGKGRGVPVGTVHNWNGVPFKKVAEGEWAPVKQAAGIHPIEADHMRRTARIQAELKARQMGAKPEPDFHARVRQVNAKAKELEGHEKEHGDREAKLRDAKLQAREKDADGAKKHMEALKDAPLEQQFVGQEAKDNLATKTQRLGAHQGREVKLEKPELAHLLKTGKYALVSAGRNPNHEQDRDLDDAAVAKRDKELAAELKKGGYAYTRVKGRYGGEEDSYLVMVHDHDDDHMVQLGKKFNQDSIITSEGGKHKMIYTTGKNAGLAHHGEGFEEKPDAHDYYSEMEHGGGKKTKFSLNFDFDNLHPHSRAPGDEGKLHNNMGPPPPENKAFVKPGKQVTPEEVGKFIRHFERDFVTLSSMADDLKKAGASHFGSRLKDQVSLLGKMQGRLSERSLNTVTDVIGARALAHSLDDQQKILAYVKEHLQVVETDDSSTTPRKDGYRAVHMLFRTPSGKLGELQIKTHRQQLFSKFTHDHIYKGKPEIKNDPEVNAFANKLSDYLHGLDKGGADDPTKRPVEPEILQREGLSFPWDEVERLHKSEGGVKFYVVVRDHKTKENKAVHEFGSWKEAKSFRDAQRAAGHQGELPIGYAHSKDEFLHTFSEYQPKGPGSRGGQVVGRTKSGKVKYQSQTKKR